MTMLFVIAGIRQETLCHCAIIIFTVEVALGYTQSKITNSWFGFQFSLQVAV